MEDTGLICWKCGAVIGDEPLPLSRTAECRCCHTPLHVCRMCTYFDPAKANACREPVAEQVRDKERANFCGYFQPTAAPPRDAPPGRDAHAAAQARFGDATDALPARTRAEDPFRG